jgi:hypothetical protein
MAIAVVILFRKKSRRHGVRIQGMFIYRPFSSLRSSGLAKISRRAALLPAANSRHEFNN